MSALFLSGGMMAQDAAFNCGHDIVFNRMLEEDPALADKIAAEEVKTQEWLKEHPYTEPAEKSGATYVIPVVFHVLHDDGPENISKENILDQLRIMNEDYQKLNADQSAIVSEFQSIIGNASVEFRLARKDPNGNCTDGIVRRKTTQTYSGKLESIGSWHWNTSRYLNVFIVRDIGLGDPGGGGVVAGYTQVPSSQPNIGIMIRYNYIGSKPPSNLTSARTLCHEIGHWLNLWHLWGSNNNPGESCNGSDNVSDTPQTEGHQSCPLTPPGNTTCGSLDNVQNYMEYSFCSKMFTKGQASRMQSAISIYRSTMVGASNLAFTGVDQPQPPCIPTADFSSSTQVVCAGSPVQFMDESWNADPTSWNWTFTGGTPNSSTDSMPSVTYNSPGTYSVTLTSGTTTGNSTAETKTSFIEVRPSTAKFTGITGYEEDFGGSNFTNDWSVEDNGGVVWEKYTGAGYNSSESVRLNNASSSSKSGDVDAFISSGIDIAGMPGTPRVYFKAAYKRAATDDNDGLKVYYSTNCGESWIVRKTLGGAALSSSSGETSSSWTPSGDSDWKEHFLTVGGGTSSDNLFLKFEFIAGEIKGNNVFIDAINVYDPASIEEDKLMDHTNLFVYPNPMEDNSVITFELFDKHPVSLKIYDVVGREVTTLVNGELNTGGHEYKIANMDLPVGIYHVQLNIEGRQFSNKLIVK